MPGTVSRVLLWLFILNLGIALGAGLYEGRIVVPRWINTGPDGEAHWNAEAARQDDTGLRFWVFTTTVPLTLLTLANLVAAARAAPPAREWWLAAGVAASLDRLFTFSYFIPTMVRLVVAPDAPEFAAAATRWASLNYVRHALVLAALLAALKAFALVYEDRGAEEEEKPSP